MKRRILAVLLAVFASLSIVSVNALPASAAIGPLLLCEKNGHGFCADTSNLNPGTLVGTNYSFLARNVYLSSAGGICDPDPGYTNCVTEYITFYDNSYMASTNSCNGDVEVKAPSATTGIVWWDEGNGSGDRQLRNQHCVGSGSYLYQDNVLYDAIKLDNGGVGGHYYKVNFITP